MDEVSEGALPSSVYEPISKEKGNIRYAPLPGEFDPGIDASGLLKRNLEFRYRYQYPSNYRELVRLKFDHKRLMSPELKQENHALRRLMKEGLGPDNYQRWFQVQLWINEVEREMNLRYFHQKGVSLSRDDSNYGSCIELIKLDVPGIIEKRPNVMVGDSIFIRHKETEMPVYEGIVHRVFEETLFLGFGDAFTDVFDENDLYDVQFWFNRVPLIRSHLALKHANKLQHILFPRPPTKPLPKNLPPLQFFDPCINNNKEQSQAVTAIVHNYSGQAPYILFGPPGTGKTLTMVEAIKQIHKTVPNCHILVSGPSNSACDLITERLLIHIPSNHIKRVNAKSRLSAGIARAVLSVSCFEDDVSIIPNPDVLSTYRIIITTFMTAAKVVPVLMTDNNDSKDDATFTHVFLDECGHGEEPEALIPLLGLGDSVILAGDPRQLGPSVDSPICKNDGRYFKNGGLDQSLLERLMNMPLYSSDKDTKKYNPRVVTKLLDNYRSHHAILHVPNECFYDGQLRSCADKKMIEAFLNWDELPNRTMPLLFHGVDGKDAREGNNPSYFNPQEVSQVIYYVDKLKRSRHHKVLPENIGIVAPYRTQVKKIKEALSRTFPGSGWAHKIRVGSPEEFQGDERKVIILSTVRATGELLLNDINLQLGFMRNPKV